MKKIQINSNSKYQIRFNRIQISNLKLNIGNWKLEISSESGITQVLVVLLLLAGVGLGTYLVQNRTNLFPKAYDPCEYAKDDPQDYRDCQRGIAQGAQQAGMSVEQYLVEDCKANPGKEGCSAVVNNSDTGSSGGGTKACDGQSLAGQSKETQEAFKVKYGNDAASGWVKEHEAELKAKGIPCTGSGSSGSTTGTNSSSQTDGTQACNTDFTPAYFDAKVANRYARYKAIIAGIPQYCVPADLGISPGLREDSKEGTVKNGRLYLCSGKNSSKDNLDLLWKVVSDDGKILAGSNKENPGSDLGKVNTVMEKYIREAETKLRI